MRIPSTDLDAYVVGTDHRLAAAVVVTTFAVAVTVLAALGALEVEVDGTIGMAAFVAVFWVLPLLVGAVCARRWLGYATAALAGLAPGVAFLVVVAAGSALGVGSFGGGDSPLLPFSLLLGSVSFVWASGGFALGVVVGLVRSRL